MMSIPRSATRGLWPALALLLLSSLVSAQNDPSLEAVERDDPRVAPERVTETAAQAPGTTPAGDMPAPLDPDQATAPDEGAGEPGPATPTTILPYDSVLEDYVPYEAVDGPNWIEANERVGEIGGWREYAKELYEPAPAAADGGDER